MKARRDDTAVKRFNKAFQLEYPYGLDTKYEQHLDLGVEYGLGAIDSLDPRSEDWKFIVGLMNEDTAEGDKQAEVIARELEEAIKGVFAKNNIELNEQTLINLSRI